MDTRPRRIAAHTVASTPAFPGPPSFAPERTRRATATRAHLTSNQTKALRQER
jgi:hypothetical protein